MEEASMRGYDRGYDYGLRGYRQTAEWRDPVRTRFVGGGYGGDYRGSPMGYGGDYRGGRRGYGEEYRGGRRDHGADHGYGVEPFSNRVTARYNLDYVREQHPGERPVNYAPYGGDRVGRVGDMREYHAPYQTTGGTRTWRGEWPMGWEHQQAPYGADFPRPRPGMGRWF
jgi:hypothetical protein